MSKCNIRPDLNDKIGFRMSKCDIRSEFECQNRISNVYLVYIYHVFKYIFGICMHYIMLTCLLNLQILVQNGIFFIIKSWYFPVKAYRALHL